MVSRSALWKLSSSLLLYKLALVWPCLAITSLERSANRIRPIPTQFPPNSTFSHPALLQGHMIFPPYQTWFVASVWRLTVRLWRSAVSGVGCTVCSSSPDPGRVHPEGLFFWKRADLIASQRGKKIISDTFKDEWEAPETLVLSWMNFEESAGWLKTQRWNLFLLHFDVDARFLMRCYDTHQPNWMWASSSSSVFEGV